MDEQTILDKAQRLSRITLLLYRHPKGLTAVELARMCNVTPRTIQRDLRDLEEMGIPFLYLETDYSAEDVGQLSTRVQALIEMVGR